MSDPIEHVGQAVDEQHAHLSAGTRRQIVAGVAATIGGMGVLGLPGMALGKGGSRQEMNGLAEVPQQDPQTILNIAATAEVLATIVNTVGAVGARATDGTKVGPVDLPRNGTEKISASAFEELIHYQVITSLGGRTATKRIWVPDVVFASADSFLATLEVGDQIFVNAYLIATTVYGNAGQGAFARVAAEIMAVEGVHRAFARDLRMLPGNDRAFMKLDQPEQAQGAPNFGQPGFVRIEGAVAQLQAAGFGFGQPGAAPGRFYDFDTVSRRTPTPDFVNTRTPR